VINGDKLKKSGKKIDKTLLKWTTSSGGVATIISGGINWQIPALGFCIVAVGELLMSRAKRREFRSSVPLAVFLDLEKRGKILKVVDRLKYG